MNKTFTKQNYEVKEFSEKNSNLKKSITLEPDEKVLSFLTQFSRVYNVSKVVTSVSAIPITMILN